MMIKTKMLSRERLLRQEAREVLASKGRAVAQIEDSSEDDREPNVNERPNPRFLQGGLMRLTDVTKKVKEDESHHDNGEDDPLPRMNHHLLGCRGSHRKGSVE